MEFYDKEFGYWIKPKGARNEPFDTVVYAIWVSLAPAVKAGVIRESQWECLESQFQPTVPGLFDLKEIGHDGPLPKAIKEKAEIDSTRSFMPNPSFCTTGFAQDGWTL